MICWSARLADPELDPLKQLIEARRNPFLSQETVRALVEHKPCRENEVTIG